VATQTLRTARIERDYVAVRGPEATDFLQRMVSNDVEEVEVGFACDALLLTPKGRVIAVLRIWRRREDDFLLLTEPGLGERVRRELVRARLRTQAEIEPEQHSSVVVFGAGSGIPTADYGEPAVEVLDADVDGEPLGEEELEALRIRAGTPRHGRELDDRVLPAEAGLVERAVRFGKGCYPGQEPIVRLHHRGHVNRRLRVLELEAPAPPPYDAELLRAGKPVGRITSAARAGDTIVALGYVRVEVPDDAELEVASGGKARVVSQ
jgi:folate-binding protein YgfZ